MMQPAAGLFHRLDRGAHAQPDADLVDPNHFEVFLQRGVLDQLAAGDAGVVDQDVEPPVLLQHRVDHGGPLGLLGDVEVEVSGVAARVVDAVGDQLALGVEHIGEHDRCTFLREEPRLRLALSARAAGNQRHFAIELAHDPSPSICDNCVTPPVTLGYPYGCDNATAVVPLECSVLAQDHKGLANVVDHGMF